MVQKSGLYLKYGIIKILRFKTKISAVKVERHTSQKAVQESPSTFFSHSSELCEANRF